MPGIPAVGRSNSEPHGASPPSAKNDNGGDSGEDGPDERRNEDEVFQEDEVIGGDEAKEGVDTREGHGAMEGVNTMEGVDAMEGVNENNQDSARDDMIGDEGIEPEDNPVSSDYMPSDSGSGHEGEQAQDEVFADMHDATLGPNGHESDGKEQLPSMYLPKIQRSMDFIEALRAASLDN
ncbi:hypothetical protein JB92DRAFT_3127547 [Gautieria morchelliformis]|nr:hypothetical protein JB92DRAFT_3127547 [Gautieria morchelliformis]